MHAFPDRASQQTHPACLSMSPWRHFFNDPQVASERAAARERILHYTVYDAIVPSDPSAIDAIVARFGEMQVPTRGNPSRCYKWIDFSYYVSLTVWPSSPASPATDLGAAGKYRFVIFRGSPSAVWTPPTSFPGSWIILLNDDIARFYPEKVNFQLSWSYNRNARHYVQDAIGWIGKLACLV